MTTDVVMRMAIWLVERGGAGSAGEALAGDLLEMFANGRDRWWCFGQALRSEARSRELRLRPLLLSIWYCVGFVLLHPLWQGLYAPSALRLLTGYRSTAVWPRSALLEIAVGLLPAVLFVWMGVFVFLLLRRRELHRMSLVRVLFSLSVGCCVVSAETVLRLGVVEHNLQMLSSGDFYYPVSHSRFSVFLFIALFAAIGLLPRGRRLSDHGRYARRLLGQRHLLRAVRTFWLMALLVPQRSEQTGTPQGLAARRLM